MKDEDAQIYSEIRARLNTLRVDHSKLKYRVSSRKVFLSGELVRLGGPPIRPFTLLELIRENIMKIRGVRVVVIEPDLENDVRKKR